MKRSAIATSVVLFAAGCVRFEPQPLSPVQTAADFESRSLDSPTLKQFVETSLRRPPGDWPPKTWDFSTLTLVAWYYHPSLDVARAQWAVAEAGIKTAGGSPNPILSVTPGYSSNPLDGVSPWFPMISVDVPIETAGKRRKRISRAGHLAESARLNLYTAAWQVRSQLRGVLLEWDAAQQRSELLSRQLKIQESLVNLLEQRRNAGAVAAVEVTPARIALLKTAADREAMDRQVASARVRLGEALGLPAQNIVSLPLDRPPVPPPANAKALLNPEMRDRALQHRPDVLAALAEYAAAESALQLEIARQYPDVHLSPGYQFDQGEHKWSLGISMELPMLNRNQGPIAEAEAKRTESATRFVALQARVIAEIDRASSAYATIRDQLGRDEKLRDLQRQQSDSVAALFRAGGADRFEVDSARLEVIAVDLVVLDTENRIQQAWGQLEDALQIPFEALNSIEQGRADRAMTKDNR